MDGGRKGERGKKGIPGDKIFSPEFFPSNSSFEVQFNVIQLKGENEVSSSFISFLSKFFHSIHSFCHKLQDTRKFLMEEQGKFERMRGWAQST